MPTIVSNDKQFVKEILTGDDAAWKSFVEQYTDWVLYTAWQFEKKFCRKADRINNCSLLSIMRRRKGQETVPPKGGNSCDEGIDLYLWLLQYLRSRLKSFRGESKLSTYIWTILNSKNLYVDILRWKYGRLDENNENRLPVAIQKLPKLEQKIFVCLRKGKDEDFICRQLSVERENVAEAVEHVRDALLQAGQLFLIERPKMESWESLEEFNKDFELHGTSLYKQGEAAVDKIFYQQIMLLLNTALKSLEPTAQKILRLYYNDGLSGKEISEFCNKFAPDLELAGNKINSQNIYYIIGKLSRQLIEVLDLEGDGEKLSVEQWNRVLASLRKEGVHNES